MPAASNNCFKNKFGKIYYFLTFNYIYLPIYILYSYRYVTGWLIFFKRTKTITDFNCKVFFNNLCSFFCCCVIEFENKVFIFLRQYIIYQVAVYIQKYGYINLTLNRICKNDVKIKSRSRWHLTNYHLKTESFI